MIFLFYFVIAGMCSLHGLPLLGVADFTRVCHRCSKWAGGVAALIRSIAWPQDELEGILLRLASRQLILLAGEICLVRVIGLLLHQSIKFHFQLLLEV